MKHIIGPLYIKRGVKLQFQKIMDFQAYFSKCLGFRVRKLGRCWISKGLQKKNHIGLEGSIFTVSKNYGFPSLTQKSLLIFTNKRYNQKYSTTKIWQKVWISHHSAVAASINVKSMWIFKPRLRLELISRYAWIRIPNLRFAASKHGFQAGISG